MRYGDDDNSLFLNPVNQRIRKARKQTSPYVLLYFSCCRWIRLNETDDPVKVIKKIQSRSIDLFIEPGDGFINFLLRECEESDVH